MPKRKLFLSLLLVTIVTARAHAMGSSPAGRRIVLNDGKNQSYPWNMIGKLDSSGGDVNSECTAVRVARRVILSAAHCFYWASGADGGIQGALTGDSHSFLDPATGGEVQVASFVTGTTYAQGSNAEADIHSGKDWAVAVLQDSAEAASKYLQLLPEGQTLAAGSALEAAGFSEDLYEGQWLSVDPSCQWLSSAAGTIATSCQMWEGASGGADLFHDSSGNFWVTGIHSLVVKTKPPTALSTSIDVFRAPLAQALQGLGKAD